MYNEKFSTNDTHFLSHFLSMLVSHVIHSANWFIVIYFVTNCFPFQSLLLLCVYQYILTFPSFTHSRFKKKLIFSVYRKFAGWISKKRATHTHTAVKGRDACTDGRQKNNFRHLMVQLRFLLAFSVNVNVKNAVIWRKKTLASKKNASIKENWYRWCGAVDLLYFLTLSTCSTFFLSL